MKCLNERPLVISAAAALAAMLFGHLYIARVEKRMTGENETVATVVASADIRKGEMIGKANSIMVRIPKRYVQPRALESLAAAGPVALVDIASGSQITSQIAVDARRYKGIAAMVPKGKRAVAMQMDGIRGGEAHVAPGDIVDVIATFDIGKGDISKRRSMFLVRDAAVISVGKDTIGLRDEPGKGSIFQRVQLSGETSPVISLAVSPEDAEKIAFARQGGALSLAVKNVSDDADTADIAPVTFSSIVEFDVGPREKFMEYKGR